MMRPTLIVGLIQILLLAVPAPAQPRHADSGDAKPAAADEDVEVDEDPLLRPAPRSDLRRSRLSDEVDRSIRKGVKFLVSRQNADGSWAVQDEREDFKIGTTALVTLALLSAGESHQSPAMVKAVTYLKSARPEKASRAVYSIGLRAAVYAQLPAAAAQGELKRDLLWLQRAMIDQGDFKGMYGYGFADGASRWGDYSNSQYGVLGVWYGAMAGVEVPVVYWRNVERGWLAGQNKDGGWSYKPGLSRSYASMTAAGAATLFITNDYLHANDAQNLSRLKTNEPLEAAIAWLGEHFAVDHNPGIDTNLAVARKKNLEDELLDRLLPALKPNTTWLHYMLFSYERVGEASGLTRFGRRKWFDEGAGYLVRTQSYDGSWSADMGEEIDTAYALLFLARGRAPVIVQKLQFDGRWNNRSRDMAAFTQFMRRASERHVNWQIVSIDDTPGELREAPILYIASDKPVSFTAEQRMKLKHYVEQGGLILAVQEGPGDAFAQSFASLAGDLFPDYRFHDLSREHPIYTANFPTDMWTDPIRGMSNGIRELIILLPSGDASWKWQSAGGAFDLKRAPYGPLANLLLHVTDKSNPRYKGDDTWVERNDAVTPVRTARVARIKYKGNWDPEPGGWARLSNVTWNFDQTKLETGAFTAEQLPALIDAPPSPQSSSPSTPGQSAAPPRIDAGKDRPAEGIRTGAALWSGVKKCPLAHLAATGPFTLTQPEIDGLRRYLDAGGILLLDAAGGNPETAVAFESLLKSIYPDLQLSPLPLDHPIYRAANIGAQDIDQVTYRRSPDRPNTRLPRLKQATLPSGQLVAIVSNEDLSAGIVGYQTAGPVGYTPHSATDLMRNVVAWTTARTQGQ